MSRIVIGALSGWQCEERRERCLSTWFPDAVAYGMDAVFLLGKPELSAPERHGHELWLPCPNEYQTLPQRTYWFCRWALDDPEWHYLFKCDDDTYVAARRLSKYPTEGRDYIGAEWKAGVGYASGGAGYFLSRRAVKIVAQRLSHPLGPEDLLVGAVMRDAGVPFAIDSRFVPWGNDELRPRADNHLITCHGVPASVFLAAHDDVGGVHDPVVL